MMALALRPAIEVHRGYLAVGRHIVFWNEIQRIDRTRWIAPLLVRLTLAGDRRVFLLYAGNQDSSMELLRHLFLQSHGALLDGIPHAQFWGETSPSSASEKRDSVPSIASRGRLLLPEDEAEVERLFQRLKTAGRLDQHGDSREAGPSGSRPRGGSRE